MRKVGAGEASAIPNSTFIGYSPRQAATNPMILKEDFEEGGLSESDLDRVWDDLQSIIYTLEDDPKYQSISESLREVMEDMIPIMAQSGGGKSDLGQINLEEI
tara:strand:+ start:1027 stop:1335 length:309 start_codon:yes stop_codon:yes gene_type:complete